ncbi:MAG: hypothetical protein KDK62_00685, partial [Chlamydiia bacterium]|nr:hypothetical protein [Chlamydiia bacterium]
LESREGLRKTVQILKKLKINYLRASLWKPRTRPGWSGMGYGFLPLLLEETALNGIIPATEVGSSGQAQETADYLKEQENAPEVILWLGSRNQNHDEQQAIARILKDCPTVTLMVKNQMWEDENHWLGIVEHVLSTGFPEERLWLCHRGFAPAREGNPALFRNVPNFEMAMWIKEQTNLKVILDPSHIGGCREKVFWILRESFDYDFDGYMIETHDDPEKALTDKSQQLTPNEIEEAVNLIRESEKGEVSRVRKRRQI